MSFLASQIMILECTDVTIPEFLPQTVVMELEFSFHQRFSDEGNDVNLMEYIFQAFFFYKIL